MANKKRCLLVILGFLLLFSFTACGKENVLEASKVTCVEDLKNVTIGVQLGTTGDIYASDYEEQGCKIERFTKAADAVSALKLGKIDCIILDNLPAEAFVELNQDLSILEEEFVNEDYAICISKENGALKEKINAAIGTLKENGTLEQIQMNYIGDNTKGQYPYVSPSSD